MNRTGLSWVLVALIALTGVVAAHAAQDIDELIKALRDKDWQVRADAARALGEMGGAAAKAVPALAKALQDKEWEVRANAAGALGRIGSTAVPALTEVLRDENSSMRKEAAIALGEIGLDARDAVPALIKALQDGNEDVRQAAARALEKISPDAVPVEEPSSKSSGARDEEFTKRKKTSDEDEKVSSDTVPLKEPSVAEKPGFPEVVPTHAAQDIDELIKALRDKDWQVRADAARALGEMGGAAAKAVPALIEALQDVDVHVRKEAVLALERIGPDAVPESAEEPSIVEESGSKPSSTRDEEFTKRKKTSDEDEKVSPDAVPLKEPSVAEKPSFPEVVPTHATQDIDELIKALRDEDWRVRADAARVLGGMGSAAVQAIPFLGEVMKDQVIQVRGAAADALVKIGPASVSTLTNLLGYVDWHVRRLAVYTLGEMGPDAREAVPALTRALRDENESVREEVTKALEKISPDTVPAEEPGIVEEPEGSRDTEEPSGNQAERRTRSFAPLLSALVVILLLIVVFWIYRILMWPVRKLQQLAKEEKERRKITIKELQSLNWSDFEEAIMKLMGGRHTQPTADMGIDGWVGDIPVQIKKHKNKVGRRTVDRFAGVMVRENCSKGYIVAFSFTKGAYEGARVMSKRGWKIELLTVEELLENGWP